MTITSALDSSVTHLKSYLEQNPAQAPDIASSHYREWKKLEVENAKLAQQCQKLKADNSILLKRCERLLKVNITLKYPRSQCPNPLSLSQLLNSKNQGTS